MDKKFVLNEPAIAYKILDDSNAYSLIQTIKRGIKFSFFEQLAMVSQFTIRDWSSILHLSERSMQRYKKEGGTFGPVSSEKIIEITMLYKFGVEVFADKGKFNTWLNIENVSLGGAKPKELLDTSFGMGLIKDELMRIEQGVLA